MGSASNDPYRLYQDSDQLMVEVDNQPSVLIQGVVDYAYDQARGTLYVLEEERSDHTDEVGYQGALSEGYHHNSLIILEIIISFSRLELNAFII